MSKMVSTAGSCALGHVAYMALHKNCLYMRRLITNLDREEVCYADQALQEGGRPVGGSSLM